MPLRTIEPAEYEARMTVMAMAARAMVGERMRRHMVVGGFVEDAH